MRLLLVEDEVRIQQVIQEGLTDDTLEVVAVSSAEEAMASITASRNPYDAFLIDIILPGIDGIAFCRWLRELGHKQPIIVLTAKGRVEDKVAGLEAGADDYLSKPFEVAELRARFRAMFRKQNGYPREPLVVADLVLDPNTRKVTRGGVDIPLPLKETLLLEYLMRNTSRVVTRAMIATSIWDTDTNQYSNVIDVFISHIRKKIDGDGRLPLVHTVRGKGFRLSPDPHQED